MLAFGLEAWERDDLLWLRLTGDFDRSATTRVTYALAASHRVAQELVVFDLRGVTFMDSAALRALVRVDQRARDEGFAVAVMRPASPASRIFSLTPLGDGLRLVNDGEDLPCLPP
jgi:anti-anti-sigma factor